MGICLGFLLGGIVSSVFLYGLIRRFFSGSPQARSTKSRARIDRFYDLTARSERGPAKAALQLEVGEARLGSKVLQLIDASCRRGEKSIFRGFT